MKSILFSCIVFFSFYSCKGKIEKEENQQNYENQLFDDSDYVLNPDFPIGDVRRYGIFPDSTYLSIHPFTIGVLDIINDNPNINILEDNNNGVLIENQQ